MTYILRPLRVSLPASLLVSLLVSFCFAPSAGAEPSISGPVVTLDRTEVHPGEEIVVTMEGFAPSTLTISVCGNEARRGSADCNMRESEGGVTPNDDGTPALREMPAAAPPVDCPCVIRVSNRNNDEVAVTPIVLIGHPVGPVIDGSSPGDLLVVSVSARSAPEGLVEAVRSDLGGPTNYQVTVTVKNRSTTPLRQVRVAASAARGSDNNLVTLDVADPELIGVGQTWQQTVSAVVPAPSFGRIDWLVVVSGAGSTVNASSYTRHRPVLLTLLALVVVINISLLAIRWTARRRIARESLTVERVHAGDASDATSSDATSSYGAVDASTPFDPQSFDNETAAADAFRAFVSSGH